MRVEHARVCIVHGFDAAPSAPWFPWLKAALEREGHQVIIDQMPSAGSPTPEQWQQALDRQVPTPDRDTYFVAHSLGCIAVLRYLESLKPDVRIGGFALVAGFNDRLAVHPQLDAFHRPALDCAKLQRMAAHRLVIAARDDPAVPHAASQRLAAALKASFISVDKGGHFLDSDGFSQFPLLTEQLRGWVQARP